MLKENIKVLFSATKRNDENIKETLEYRMWRALLTVADGIQDTVVREFLHGKKDVSLKQHMVMRKVCDMMSTQPKGIPLKDLASALYLTPGTTSELVEKLVRKDALKRVQNPDDRRAVMITVTEKSKKMLIAAEKRINEYIKDVWNGFEEAEKQNIIGSLEKLVKKINEQTTAIETK